jgi:UDP-glucose 4-epimerase
MTEVPSALQGQRWTVVGARGWIGSALVAYLQRAGAKVTGRSHFEPPHAAAGRIVWCSGVAHGADDAPRPSFRAHVAAIDRWLDAPDITSFTYLSSTRLYDNCASTNEDTDLVLRHDAIYAMTKPPARRW